MTAQTTASAGIDRATAAQLNPLISQFWTSDTLSTLARLTDDLGFFISISEAEGSEARFGNMYLILGAVSAALAYESKNTTLKPGKHAAEQEMPA